MGGAAVSLEPNLRIVFIRRADVTQSIERRGKQLEQLLQPHEIFNDAYRVELQLVHAFGKCCAEEAFIIQHAERQLRLGGQLGTKIGVSKKSFYARFIIRFDDEGFVEVLVADLDILEAELLRDWAEDVRPRDREAEAVAVHIRRPQASEDDGRFSSADGEGIERNDPLADFRVDAVAGFPPFLRRELPADLLGEQAPDFSLARAKDLA